MKRIKIEILIFAIGLVLTSVGILSDNMFNAGIVLPIGIGFLAVAFMVGLTEKPFVQSKTTLRKAILVVEFVCAIVGTLFVTGVIVV